MSKPIFDQTFENQDFSNQKLKSKEYDQCIFKNCDFTNADICVITFLECTFVDCNFSMTKLKTTALQEVRFKNCKMLGLHFGDCSDFLFSVIFNHCILDYSSFVGFDLKQTKFLHCSLQEVDFTETKLTGCEFDHCDFFNAIFEHTIADKVDFRTSFNYTIDPEINKLKKATFSSDGLKGLLQKYDLIID